MAAAFRLPSPGFGNQCNNVRKEGRKRTGLAWEDSGDFYSDKLKQLRTLRALKTSTLSVVSAITLSIRIGCLPLIDRAPESSLRLSPRVPTPRWLYWVSPRQLLQSDTGVPHFALDPLTYRCLLSLSPAADFAEPRPPRHTNHRFSFCCIYLLLLTRLTTVLLSTLSSLGITGIPLRWFESYLTDRSFKALPGFQAIRTVTKT